jgi:hypothetical protein
MIAIAKWGPVTTRQKASDRMEFLDLLGTEATVPVLKNQLLTKKFGL